MKTKYEILSYETIKGVEYVVLDGIVFVDRRDTKELKKHGIKLVTLPVLSNKKIKAIREHRQTREHPYARWQEVVVNAVKYAQRKYGGLFEAEDLSQELYLLIPQIEETWHRSKATIIAKFNLDPEPMPDQYLMGAFTKCISRLARDTIKYDTVNVSCAFGDKLKDLESDVRSINGWVSSSEIPPIMQKYLDDMPGGNFVESDAHDIVLKGDKLKAALITFSIEPELLTIEVRDYCNWVIKQLNIKQLEALNAYASYDTSQGLLHNHVVTMSRIISKYEEA